MGQVLAVLAAAMVGGCTGDVKVFLQERAPDTPGSATAEAGGGAGAATTGWAQVLIPIDTLEARPERSQEWTPITGGFDPYNLLDFSGEPFTVDLATLPITPAVLAYDELPAGAVDAIRIKLDLTQAPDVVRSGGTHEHVELSPDIDAALEVPLDLNVAAGKLTEITLAIDTAASFTPATGGGWVFLPVLSVVE